MRFLQISSFYDQYLSAFRLEHPELTQQSHAQQLQALVDDGFGAQHLFGAHFHELGYESKLVIPNDRESQIRWAQENGVSVGSQWQQEIVRAQVERLKPDVLYVTDAATYDSKFLATLSHRPALTVAWAVMVPPPGTDYRLIDLILTTNYCAAAESRAAGARCFENFLPGMPAQLLKRLPQNKKEFDLVFCGQVGASHKRRVQFLHNIARSALRTGKFRPAFFIQNNPELPAEILHFAQPAQWGVRMLEKIALAKIGFHLSIDFAGKLAGAMRLFETTFVGTLFLGEQDPSLAEYFKIGTEVASFQSEQDLEEKILHYLSHDSEREKIAKAGQARCLSDHSMQRRLQDFDRIIQLNLKRLGRSVGVHQVPAPALEAPAAPPVSPPASRSTTAMPPKAAAAIEQGVDADLLKRFPDVAFGSLVQILGTKNTSIGKGSAIGDNCWLNVCIRDDQIRMRIGKGVLVGRGSVLSTAGQFELADYCLLAPQVYIADSDHIYEDIMSPIVTQGVTQGRKITVEENCWLGIHAVVTGHVTVGRGSVIAANCVVIRDVPPFSIVVGNPARIVKMYNPRTRTWERCSEPAEMERILQDRERHPLPTREEYRAILETKGKDVYIDPINTGRGVWW